MCNRRAPAAPGRPVPQTTCCRTRWRRVHRIPHARTVAKNADIGRETRLALKPGRPRSTRTRSRTPVNRRSTPTIASIGAPPSTGRTVGSTSIRTPPDEVREGERHRRPPNRGGARLERRFEPPEDLVGRARCRQGPARPRLPAHAMSLFGGKRPASESESVPRPHAVRAVGRARTPQTTGFSARDRTAAGRSPISCGPSAGPTTCGRTR